QADMETEHLSGRDRAEGGQEISQRRQPLSVPTENTGHDGQDARPSAVDLQSGEALQEPGIVRQLLGRQVLLKRVKEEAERSGRKAGVAAGDDDLLLHELLDDRLGVLFA